LIGTDRTRKLIGYDFTFKP